MSAQAAGSWAAKPAHTAVAIDWGQLGMLAWHRILILLLTRCDVTSQDCEVQRATQSQAGAAVPRRGAAYAARLRSSQRPPERSHSTPGRHAAKSRASNLPAGSPAGLAGTLARGLADCGRMLNPRLVVAASEGVLGDCTPSVWLPSAWSCQAAAAAAAGAPAPRSSAADRGLFRPRMMRPGEASSAPGACPFPNMAATGAASLYAGRWEATRRSTAPSALPACKRCLAAVLCASSMAAWGWRGLACMTREYGEQFVHGQKPH